MLNRFEGIYPEIFRYADKLSGYIQIFWEVIRTNWVFGAGWRLRRLGRIGVLGRVFSMSLLRTAFACLIGGLLSGCVSTPHPNHHHQGKVPPRLVVLWLHPESFGPVPPDQKARGDETCAHLNSDDLKFVPTGFHAKAEKPGGIPFDLGGFYCEPVRHKKRR